MRCYFYFERKKRDDMKKGIVFIIICLIAFLFSTKSLEQVDLDQKPTAIHVLVEGEVSEPGDYTIESGTVENLLNQIELTNDANCQCIDLKRELYDGDQVYIPSLNEATISLNQASKEDLMTIKGIGQKKAESIIEYRTQHPFTSIEQILDIKGVGQKTYLKWRPYLCL